jgi:hypothetical protein
MSQARDVALQVVVIGVGATAVMDIWLLLLRQLGVPTLNFAYLGRWVGHLPRRRWTHDSIAKAAPIAGELWIGWAAHYAIGIAFAVLPVLWCGSEWARSPSLLPALLTGVVTAVAPLFVLQPALGAGIASSKTPAPVRNSVKSLANHTVYGLGLYLAAHVSALLVAR